MLIINELDGIEGDDELIKKFIKSKIGKLSKFQKWIKLKKKSSKNKNLPRFNIKKIRSSFLTSNTRIIFNYLQLIFIKTLIL